MRGIAAVKPGAAPATSAMPSRPTPRPSAARVVRDFCGHGLGPLFHDMPNILHYGRPGEGIMLKPGMFFTIEPMINLGRPQVKVLSDGWTAVTRDRSLSAQFEHTVGVTERGCEVFTPPAWDPNGLRRAAAKFRLALAAGARACTAAKTIGRSGPKLLLGSLAASYQATASACASASATAAPEALARLRAPGAGAVPRHPRRDTKPLAKQLIESFGSFAERRQCARTRLKEIEGVGEAVITELKLMRAAALRLMKQD